MKTVIVIPARKGSTRLPGKPLIPILGKPLLYRTWKIAQAVERVHSVAIATDDEEIQSTATQWGATVIMTRQDCQNGSERVFEAVNTLSEQPEIVINLQGDAVLTPPWVLQALVDQLQNDPTVSIATPATALSWQMHEEALQTERMGRSSGTFVVFDLHKNALYFSKKVIPGIRDPSTDRATHSHSSPIYRHIGLYAYRYPALAHYVHLRPSALETLENLEQLRLLENGIPIRVVLVDYQGRTHASVDTFSDIERVESILQQEGECPT